MEYITLDEYTSRKKKKKGIENSITLEEYVKQKGAKSAGEDDIAPVRTSAKNDEDISPVGTSNNSYMGLTTPKTKIYTPKGLTEKTKDVIGNIELVKKSAAFDDGYNFGDITGTVLGTAGKAVTSVGKGAIGLAEGVADAILYGASGVAGIVGADKASEYLKKEAMKNTTEWMHSNADKVLDEYSVLGSTTEAAAQGIGQVGALGVIGAGAEMAGLGVKGITALTQGIMGASTFGSSMGEAYKGGATDAEAVTYGAITGASAVFTEMLFGGLGKAVKATGFGSGLSQADDMLAKKLTEKINNVLTKNLVSYGVKAGAEGFEEVLDGAVNIAAKKLTYMSEEDLKKIIEDENLLEQFLVGSLTSGMMQSGMIPGTYQGSLREANKTGRDFITGYTQNEQKVIDKEAENRVAEREKDGKKLTAREKTAIKEQVEKDLQKGYISIDTIESVLGGKTYEDYKAMTDKESALKAEIEGLQKDPRATAQNRLQEAQAELDKITNGTEKAQLKDRLSLEVRELTKNSVLGESYNEKARRGQSFKADLSKYDAKQREVVKRAAESGILNNTNRTHDFVDMIAKISADKGVSFDFMNNESLKRSGFAVQGKTVNGLVKGKDVILNIDSNKALNTVVGHEITHVLEGTELYSELQNIVKEYATTKGEYDARLKAITQLYEGVEGAVIENELTAELIGEYLFTDSDFVSKLSTEKPNIFKKIYEEIKYLCKVATAGSKEARQLEKVKKVFDKAYKNTTVNTSEGVKFSLMEFSKDGRRFVEIDQNQDRFEGHDRSEYPRIAKGIINEKFNGKVIGIDNKMFVNGRGRDEYVNPSKPIKEDYIYDAKMRASTELDNLLDAGTNFRNEDDGRDGHVHGNVIGGFDYYDALFKVGDYYFEATINIANTQKGKLFKDVTKIKDVTEAIMNSYGNNPKFQFLRTSSKDSIAQNQQNATQNQKNLSLSTNGEIAPPIGNYNVHGKDIALEDIGPVREDIVTSQQTHTAKGVEGAPIRSDIPKQTNAQKSEIEELPIKTTAEKLSEKQANVQTELANVKALREQAKQQKKDKINSLQATYDALKNKDTKKAKALELRIEKQKRIAADIDATYAKRIDTLTKRQERLAKEQQKDHSNKDRLARAYARIDRELTAQKTELVKDFDEKRNALASEVENKAAFISKRADEIYDEISNLRKGIRASKDLGYLLDMGFSWNEIKQSLLRVAHSPTSTVDKNSACESACREVIDGNYMDRQTELESLDAEFESGLANLEMKAEKDKDKARIANQRRLKQQEYTDLAKKLIGDTSTWKDKKTGIAYQINTLRRNLRDIVRDKNGNKDIARADAITDELQGKYNHNEALLNKQSNKIRQAFAEMKINSKEDVYIQMLGEYRHNPATTLTADVVTEYYENHKKSIDMDKVNTAIERARKLYDFLYDEVNRVLREQGMQEIEYRKGYFPHFTEEKQGIIAKALNWKTQNDDIPTDIAGLTELYNPERSWQSFNKKRTSDTTDYSFKKGLDTYVRGSLDWIYHIEDIQKRRTFENEIRYRHSEKGVQEKIDAIRENDEYDADEAQVQIDAVLKEAKNPLNNFIVDFRNATNNLAGKKDSNDRGMETKVNREIYSTMTNISNRVSANMVGGSISSALTNWIPITQSWAEVSPISSLKAMKDTLKSYIRDDGMIDKSDFMTNRLKTAENLYKSGWDITSDAMGFLMEGIDNITTQTVWRSKYLENINSGMSEAAAIKNADRFAENVIAGRSRGNMPTIFNSKNIVTKMFTAFQLEVNNQYGYMFKDLPVEMADKARFRLVAGYAKMFVGAYVYNALYSTMVGRDAAFDPIGILEDLFRDLFPGEEEEEDLAQAVLNLGENIAQELPFVGGMLGGGRTPLSSAIPYDDPISMVKGSLEDLAAGNWRNLGNEWLNALFYLGMPMAGGQIRKTIQGLSMFDDDLPIAGSYTTSGKLRFPVEDNFANRLQAAVFGQWANPNARAYFDQGRLPLEEKQIEEFVDLNIPIQEYWEYRDGLSEQENVEDTFDYIAGLDLPMAKKNIMINNEVDRKEEIDLSDYDEYANYREFDFATKHPEEYLVSKVAASNPARYRKYKSELVKMEADKDENGKSISGSRKKKVTDYINSLDIEYGEKIVLYKSEYPGDDTYNQEIVDYLNSREDISYSEMETILTELGFTVEKDGTVRW